MGGPSLLPRIAAYQAARFPLLAYVPMVAAAAFCAVSYSAAARGSGAAPGVAAFVVAGVGMLGLFFLLRVLDEHKDADTDARFRPELPVPSGLVTLRGLRHAASLVLAAIALASAALEPRLLITLAVAVGYAALMGREFFVRDWLRARPLAYLLSHMVVMPLVVLHASAADWLRADAAMPSELWLLLAFAFLNGLVIEIGRKLRAPGEERPGVETYTASWGIPIATAAWLAALAGAAATLVLCARAIERTLPALLVAVALVVVAAAPAIRLTHGKRVEVMAGVWALGSYLLLGSLALLALLGGATGG